MTAATGIDPALLAHRRVAVTQHPTQQGIDRVDVTPGAADALTLTVFFLPGAGPGSGKPGRPDQVGTGNIRIDLDDPAGAPHPQDYLRVVEVAPAPDAPDALLIQVIAWYVRDPSARSATYVLGLVDVPTVDPFFASAPFTTGSVLHVEPPADGSPAPPAPASWPVDYQARDFGSIRDLMLDRLAQLMPTWRDTEPADLLHTVVEVLAYAGDHLSYFQDAVATEAYLGTARRRISVRRHARLLDYVLHEGCNARVWVRVTLTPGPPVVLPAGTRVLTVTSGAPGVTDAAGTAAPGGGNPTIDEAAVAAAVADGAEVFETIGEARLDPTLNLMELYDWGLDGYALPSGACVAELRGEVPALAPGAVLLLFPAAGTLPDEDGLPRVCAVRVTDVQDVRDALAGDGAGLALTRVTWHGEDALRRPLPVSSMAGGRPAVARGTVVLADHGRTVGPETLPGPLPGGPARFRARLPGSPLTWREEYPADAAQRSATALLRQDPRKATPAVRVQESFTHPGDQDPAAISFQPRPDLLGSDRRAPDLVVEIDDDGTAQLRFGDGAQGRAVDPSGRLTATYRIGNAEAGNVGRDAIAALARPAASPPPTGADPFARVTAVSNPLPAAGGTAPEPLDTVRLLAPHAFTVQQRCVIEADFVAVAQRHPLVRRAAAAFRWSGSWTTALVVVDRQDGLTVDDALLADLHDWFEPYRLAGGDIHIRGPATVSVDVVVQAAVAAGHRPDLVERALRAAFGTTVNADGTRQFFHPARFTIGDPLYLSQLIAQASGVQGVAWADVPRLQRRGQPPAGELERGVLPVAAHEVLRVAPGDVTLVVTDPGGQR